MKKVIMSLKRGLIFALVLSISFSYGTMKSGIANAKAAELIPNSKNTTIYPNKLIIQWEGGSSVTIDSFRIFGYNVTQLRTVINALDGAVVQLPDKSYQIEKTSANKVYYSDVNFSKQRDINYIINANQVRGANGEFVYPEEPGLVFLPEYGYNWGSIRDVIRALDLSLVSYKDDPANGSTTVVIAQKSVILDDAGNVPLGYVSGLHSGWEEPRRPGGSTSMSVVNTDIDDDIEKNNSDSDEDEIGGDNEAVQENEADNSEEDENAGEENSGENSVDENASEENSDENSVDEGDNGSEEGNGAGEEDNSGDESGGDNSGDNGNSIESRPVVGSIKITKSKNDAIVIEINSSEESISVSIDNNAIRGNKNTKISANDFIIPCGYAASLQNECFQSIAEVNLEQNQTSEFYLVLTNGNNVSFMYFVSITVG